MPAPSARYSSATISAASWRGRPPLLHPDRIAGVVGLSVPPVPRPRVPTTQAFKKVFGDDFFYILYFQEPGPADAELSRDPATTLRRLMGARVSDDEAAALRMLKPGPEGFIDRIPEPAALPDWISQDEFDHYVSRIHRTGFTGPLNWYRCFDRNWELTATTPAATIAVPPLFIGGTADPTLAYTRRHRVQRSRLRRLSRGHDRGRRPLGPAGAARTRSMPRCSISCPDWS